MMDGKSKAQLLLSLLGPAGRGVLERLSKGSAQLLTTGIDNLPPVSADMKINLIRETQTQVLGGAPMGDTDPFDEPVSLGHDTPDSDSDVDPFSAEIPLESNEPAAATVQAVVEVVKPIAAPTPTPTPDADYAEIGASLGKQRPQVIAFILSRLDETMKASVQRHIPANVLAEAKSKSLEMIPMSEKVYQKIYDSVFKNLN